MTSINNIYEALKNRKEKVCNKEEIFGIILEYKKTFKAKINNLNTLKYLSRHNYITRIFLNYYYINDYDEQKNGNRKYDDKEILFIVLNKLNIMWYLGLNSALYTLGKIWQVPRKIFVINNKFKGEKKILNLIVCFSKFNTNLFFGLKETKTSNGFIYYYSNIEKTYTDLAYLKKISEINLNKKTKKYLRKYPKWLRRKLI